MATEPPKTNPTPPVPNTGDEPYSQLLDKIKTLEDKNTQLNDSLVKMNSKLDETIKFNRALLDSEKPNSPPTGEDKEKKEAQEKLVKKFHEWRIKV